MNRKCPIFISSQKEIFGLREIYSGILMEAKRQYFSFLYVLMILAVMAGCSNGGGDSTTVSTTVTGQVQASYINGVRVCVDESVGTSSENCAITVKEGNFTLPNALGRKLSLLIDTVPLGSIPANQVTSTITIIPLTLASGDTTKELKIKAIFHQAGTRLNDLTYDLSAVKRTDIDATSLSNYLAGTTNTLTIGTKTINPAEEQYVLPPPVGDTNQADFGHPMHVRVYPPDDPGYVVFGLIADTHVDASTCSNKGDDFSDKSYGYNNSKRMWLNRYTVYEINDDCNKYGCLGIVHLGDAVEGNDTQRLVAFRQLWENNYPGNNGGAIKDCLDTDYYAYSTSEKYRINFPVFPTLGNHDVPPYKSGENDWNKVQDYLAQRIMGADGIISYKEGENNGAYAWKWGHYYFIQLGLWAGADALESSSKILYDKLNQLRNFLETNVYKNDYVWGVLIFQHYGWDSFSKNMNGVADWWSDFQRNLELEVLCNRPDSKGNPCDPNIDDCPCSNDFKVLGVFSGHAHFRSDIPVYPGKGNPFFFYNFVMPDVGVNSNDQMGYSIVVIDSQRKMMTINSKNRNNNTWDVKTMPINPVGGVPYW